MKGAVISRIDVAAAHDGAAELIVTLRHGNGGESRVVLDEAGAAALLEACDASRPEDAEGQSWTKVQQALTVSWNRFSTATGGSRQCST